MASGIKRLSLSAQLKKAKAQLRLANRALLQAEDDYRTAMKLAAIVDGDGSVHIYSGHGGLPKLSLSPEVIRQLSVRD